MDRQELRLVFERGDVTLFDWVPTRARIHALVDERQTRDLCDLFPGARLDVAASYGGKDRACRGRGKAIDAYQIIELSSGDGQAKSPLYGRLLRSMMEDQVAWIRDRNHRRVVTEANGRDSLATRLRGRRAGPPGGGRPMTVPRLSTRLLLRPEDVPPSRDDFEVVGVFNPGAVRAGDEVVLLVRVAERPRERRPGFTGLPRWDPAGGLTIDWVPDAELDPVDPRVVRRKADGLVRLTFISHLRVVRCGDGRAVREVTDVTFRPQAEMEEFGVEDPRITPLAAGSTSPTWPSRGTARRRPWRPRPTSARSSGTGSSSAPRTRTWSCSRSRSAGPSRRSTGRSAARRSPGRRCGSHGRPT